MNTFMSRVNEILIQNEPPQPNMPVQEVYPETGIGALENVSNGVPRQTEIMGQPHMLAYINPQEEALIQSQRGGMPAFEGPDGVPAYAHGGFHWNDFSTYTPTAIGKSLSSTASNIGSAFSDTVKEVATLGAADTDTYNNGGDTNYTVASGDTLSDIAASNNMSVGEIQAANPDITNTDAIQTGQILNLSDAGSGSDTYAGGVGLGGIGSEPVDVGGAAVVPVALNAVEKILASDYGWIDNGDGTLTDKYGNLYNNDPPAEPITAASFIPAAVDTNLSGEYYNKLTAAGEDDLSGLDAIAASNVTADGTIAGTDISVPEPTAATVTGVETYYSPGGGSKGSSVDFDTTASGADFVTAAEADTQDITVDIGGNEIRTLENGTQYTVDSNGDFVGLVPLETADVTRDVNGNEIRTLSGGIQYTVDSNGTYVGLVPLETAPVDDTLVTSSNIGDVDYDPFAMTTNNDALLNLTAGMAGGNETGSSASAGFALLDGLEGGDALTADQVEALMPFADDNLGTIVGLDDILTPAEIAARDFMEKVAAQNTDTTATTDYDFIPDTLTGVTDTSATATGTTETDDTVLSGYAGMSQNDFLNAAGSDVQITSRCGYFH